MFPLEADRWFLEFHREAGMTLLAFARLTLVAAVPVLAHRVLRWAARRRAYADKGGPS